MKKNNLERNFVLPFPESFLPTWDLWKEYKKDEWNFKYKSVLSEQSAANLLKRLSKGDENLASAIIRQSMENRWKGFFPYKNLNAPANGTVTSNNGKVDKSTGAKQLLGLLRDEIISDAGGVPGNPT